METPNLQSETPLKLDIGEPFPYDHRRARWAIRAQQRRMAEPQIQLVARKGDQVLANYGLEPGEYLIGRDPACPIAINSPEISRKHALLRITSDQLILEDIGGRFGTQVDSHQIVGAVTIQPGQIITIGRTNIELHKLEPSPTPEPPMPERYERVRLLAKGGMGEVHLALDRQLQRHVAIKVMTPEIAASKDLAGRFTQEAIVLGRLDHPHIVPIHDLGNDAKGRCYYAMKFVRGTTLKEVLAGLRQGTASVVERYPLARLLHIFQKICDAVGYAHSKGIIHRDLKPANIMIGEFGEVLVMDWGIAKILNHPETTPETTGLQSTDGTQYGTVMGTPSFMAPEQAEGRLEAINERTDIYSLGAILYNILTLRPPITGTKADADLMERVKAGRITPPAAFNEDPRDNAVLLHCPDRQVPEALSAVAMQALAKEQASRYAEVAELHRDIAAYTAGYAPVAEKAGTFRQLRLTLQRHATLAAATSIIALLLMGFAIHTHFKERRQAAAMARYEQLAPVGHELAAEYMAQGQFREAHPFLRMATELAPDNADYWQQLARVQLALQQPGLAQRTLKRAEAAGGVNRFTTQAGKLCDRLVNQYGSKRLPLHGMGEVFHWQRKHGMEKDAAFSLSLINAERTASLAQAREGVQALGLSGRIQQDPQGFLDLNLAGTRTKNLDAFNRLPIKRLNLWQTQVADLQALSQMPLEELQLAFTPANDLSPLKGRPLRSLVIAYAPITDIRPLTGAPLTHLKLSGTKVEDLNPIEKMPLRTLHLDRTPINSIAPLAGLPIRELRLDGCTNLRDLKPLAQCTNLEILTLPRNPGDISFLKNLPKLKRISYVYDERSPEKVEPAAQFWRTHNLASRR